MEQGSRGRMPYSWFHFEMVKNVSREKTEHSCQIPQRLSEMLTLASTQPGDVCLIHFGGSGSEIEVCQQHGRHFISAEINPDYYALIQNRIAAFEGGRQFMSGAQDTRPLSLVSKD